MGEGVIQLYETVLKEVLRQEQRKDFYDNVFEKIRHTNPAVVDYIFEVTRDSYARFGAENSVQETMASLVQLSFFRSLVLFYDIIEKSLIKQAELTESALVVPFAENKERILEFARDLDEKERWKYLKEIRNKNPKSWSTLKQMLENAKKDYRDSVSRDSVSSVHDTVIKNEEAYNLGRERIARDSTITRDITTALVSLYRFVEKNFIHTQV